MPRFSLPIVLAASLFAAPAMAEPAARQLSLEDCLRAVVAQNPELESERLGAAIGALGHDQAAHRYGLSLRLGPSLERSVRPTSQSFLSGVSRLDEWSQSYNMALRQGLMTGGDLAVRLSNNVFDTNSSRVDFNPTFTPGATLSFTQPLLRDWWAGGREIELARLGAEDAQLGLQGRRLRVVAEAEVAYWQLVAAREEIRVREQSLALVRNLLVINREKAKAGLLARLDVLQAEASLAVRESSLLESQRSLAAAEDRLRRLIDPNFLDPAWQRPIVPTDKPAFLAVSAAFDESWAIARARRPDLAQSAIETARQRVALDQAWNRLWPRVDVSGTAGVTNLDRSLESAVGEMTKAQNFNLQGGLNVEWPLGPNADRDEYEKARLRVQQAEARRLAAEQNAFVDVRESVRDVAINAKRVEATALAKRLAAAKLDAEQEKMKAGLSTNFQVLEFQKDLEEASLAEVKATIEYLQSLTRLEQSQGTLLERRGLVAEPSPYPAFDWR